MAAAQAAVDRFVEGTTRIALGTGSTAAAAVRALRARWPTGAFDCVASSRVTEELARSLGLQVRPLRGEDRFDLMLDGADEVAPDLSLTKGGGGALFREKLLAQLSRKVVILVDPTKLVGALGERCSIPVEVVPYARPVLEQHFGLEGFEVHRRPGPGGRPFVTDNGNEILDLRPQRPVPDARVLDLSLRAVTGVVETGVFVGLASHVIVGRPDGSTEDRLPRSQGSG